MLQVLTRTTITLMVSGATVVQDWTARVAMRPGNMANAAWLERVTVPRKRIVGVSIGGKLKNRSRENPFGLTTGTPTGAHERDRPIGARSFVAAGTVKVTGQETTPKTAATESGALARIRVAARRTRHVVREKETVTWMLIARVS